jgi:molecular chaperone GrpE
MTDNGSHAPNGVGQNPDELVNTGQVEGSRPADTVGVEGGSTADPMEALAKEAAEFRDRWLRALADMENLRRRTEREVADARTYGVTGFARDMVGVADNLRRALDTVPPELRDGAEGGIKALIEGVELTDRELAKALEKHGIKKLNPHGQKFDPNFHQAMFEIPDASVPAGTVVQVVQEGYVIGDRVLRPALVAVAKGGAKTPVAAANDNPASGSAADPVTGK